MKIIKINFRQSNMPYWLFMKAWILYYKLIMIFTNIIQPNLTYTQTYKYVKQSYKTRNKHNGLKTGRNPIYVPYYTGLSIFASSVLTKYLKYTFVSYFKILIPMSRM